MKGRREWRTVTAFLVLLVTKEASVANGKNITSGDEKFSENTGEAFRYSSRDIFPTI